MGHGGSLSFLSNAKLSGICPPPCKATTSCATRRTENDHGHELGRAQLRRASNLLAMASNLPEFLNNQM